MLGLLNPAVRTAVCWARTTGQWRASLHSPGITPHGKARASGETWAGGDDAGLLPRATSLSTPVVQEPAVPVIYRAPRFIHITSLPPAQSPRDGFDGQLHLTGSKTRPRKVKEWGRDRTATGSNTGIGTQPLGPPEPRVFHVLLPRPRYHNSGFRVPAHSRSQRPPSGQQTSASAPPELPQGHACPTYLFPSSFSSQVRISTCGKFKNLKQFSPQNDPHL